jgi:hypothetical protein
MAGHHTDSPDVTKLKIVPDRDDSKKRAQIHVKEQNGRNRRARNPLRLRLILKFGVGSGFLGQFVHQLQ